MNAESLFESMVVVVFQIIFYSEMHQNIIVLFFKNHSWYQRVKIILKH